MINLDIQNILSSKPHDQIYLKKYIDYIKRCNRVNSDKTLEELGYTENHHVCPKAVDLFPEYASFKNNSWNKIVLTYKQHLISHYFLCKTYRGSQLDAFLLMFKVNGSIITSLNDLAELKQIRANNEKLRLKYLVDNGLHNFQQSEHIENNKNRIKALVDKGEYFLQQPEYVKLNKERQDTLVANNAHIWQNTDFKIANAKKTSIRVLQDIANGVHNLQSSELIEFNRNRLLELSSAGLHQWQTDKYRRDTSKRSSKRMSRLASENQHPMQLEHNKIALTERAKSLYNRENVVTLRSLVAAHNIKLGTGWWQKSNKWIDDKIIELSNDH